MADHTKKKEPRERGREKFFHKPSKKVIISGTAVLLLGVLFYLVVSAGFPSQLFSGKTVSFTPLTKEEIPQTIEKDVIPEYRDLERALGCLVNGKVYVVVTRGEKPTAGYDLSIQKIALETTKDGSNLLVTALFKEPAEEETVSRIITYPYAVAETELTGLPDTIELCARYEK